jgi:hypothetical protein
LCAWSPSRNRRAVTANGFAAAALIGAFYGFDLAPGQPTLAK